MNEQQKKEYLDLLDKAHEYVYNVLFDDKYTPEKYKTKVEEIANKPVKERPYTDYDVVQSNINQLHLIEGYSAFGRDFLVAAISQDLDSAVNMFENAVQQNIDIMHTVTEVMNKMENKVTNDNEGGE